MKTRYAPLFLAQLPVALMAQQQLPGFQTSDTLTIPCPQDSSINILTYVGWEAYQTLDDTWGGPRDPDVCIDLAHVISPTFVAPRVLFDQIDADRPVFLRALYTDDLVLPLNSDTQYAIGFQLYAAGGLDDGPCAEGPCTSIRAAVRIPDAEGTGTDLRWYEAGVDLDQWTEFTLNLCVPTERFEMNDLREFVISMKAASPQPGGYFSLDYNDVRDLDQWGMLLRLTEAVLPNYSTSQFTYDFYDWASYLVMYTDSTYPSPDSISYLDFTPIPNVPDPATVTVTLHEYSGFNFQPYSQLRGGLIAGDDSIRHTLTVVNQGADLCFTSMIIELVWRPGDRFIHESGHVDFEGLRSCFMFLPGSALEIAPGSTFHYGRPGRGMLALFNGSELVIGAGAELVMAGTLVMLDPPGTTTQQDMHLTLRNGARLSFAPGSGIHNANTIDQSMRLVVTLDGGSIDISGLSAEDQEKVVVVQLPKEELTSLLVLGNPVQDLLRLQFDSRKDGLLSLRGMDALGRLVIAEQRAIAPGQNQFELPVHQLRPGSYIMEATIGEERRVLRFVKE